ncbi:hypothetical protein FGK63_08605 [Ruegeria sediminis]|uniref:DUF3987 domain-containing protein n=1 Tax=Ruegeria sediminis TaxID=2583820 RepID=A0ABY2WY96_9RHOB|nr:hypothetical protein [Ruegeria sediminis]TMV07522.1 hypothetical protein FGK63_08605 [Ruegeria sediminis]
MNEITPKPFEDASRPSEKPEMWVQEAIFGHRFIEEQKPYMLVLEVLSVCGSVLRSGTSLFSHGLVDATRSEAITVSIAKRAQLRYLLFEDTALDKIRLNETLTDDEKLDRFVNELNKGFRGRTKVDNAFCYLGERFRGRFSSLAQAIDILRNMEIDALSSRRWTSRFLAPRGPKLLISDIGNSFSSDRRFFGRGGELMYLMLSRSNRASEAAQLIQDHFFSTSDPMDRLLSEIDPESEERTGDAPLGYLPLSHHHSYDRLANDWITVLSLAGLPSPQKFEPLFRLSALNLVRYFMERAAEVGGLCDADGRPSAEPIILDVSGGAIGDMRQRAASHLKRVRETIDEAVEAYIQGKIEKNTKWSKARGHSDPDLRFKLAVEAIHETFHTGIFDKEKLSRRSPEACLSFFVKRATSRSRNNISTLIEPLGKNAGFITARPRAGTWFDGSDEFLEALVMSNTGSEAITVDKFLHKIYEKYRIVIGPNEAGRAFAKRTFDPSSFEENMRFFEQRLTGLGYVRRLSDDCAFVSNPYAI